MKNKTVVSTLLLGLMAALPLTNAKAAPTSSSGVTGSGSTSGNSSGTGTNSSRTGTSNSSSNSGTLTPTGATGTGHNSGTINTDGTGTGMRGTGNVGATGTGNGTQNNGTLMDSQKTNDITTPGTNTDSRTTTNNPSVKGTFGRVESVNRDARTMRVRDEAGNVSDITISEGAVYSNRGKKGSTFTDIKAGDRLNYSVGSSGQADRIEWDTKKTKK